MIFWQCPAQFVNAKKQAYHSNPLQDLTPANPDMDTENNMKFGLEILLHLGLQARLESRFQDARLVLIVLILNRLRQLTVYISP